MASQFSCVINCMDGRVQSAVINYIVNKYGTPYVDVVTAAGPAKILAEHKKHRVIRNIKFRTSVSVTSHEAKHLLIAGHFDCALIDTSDEKQKEYILKVLIQNSFNKTLTAKQLKVSIRSLYYKIEKYGIEEKIFMK